MDPMDVVSMLNNMIMKCFYVSMIRNGGCSKCLIRRIMKTKKRNLMMKMNARAID